MNLEEWYQWLAAFTGLLCKKHTCVGGAGCMPWCLQQLLPPACGCLPLAAHLAAWVAANVLRWQPEARPCITGTDGPPLFCTLCRDGRRAPGLL